jgi:hypothetical protein
VPRIKKETLLSTTPAPTAPPQSFKEWLKAELNDKGFRHSVTGAFIGGILAIFAGLAVFTLQTINQHHQELKIQTQQRRILLQGFKNSLEDNMTILIGIMDPKSPSIIVNNVNMNYFQSTAQLKYTALNNIKLATAIDDLTFKLNSLEQAIKNFQSIYYNPLTETDKKFLATRGRDLRTSIIVGAKQALGFANVLLTEINKELAQMDKDAGTTHEP